MMIFDMGDALEGLTQPVEYYSVTQTIVDYKPAEQLTLVDGFEAVVQPAERQRLDPDTYDFSLRHKLLHSRQPMATGDQIVHAGITYRAPEDADYSDYGFYEAVFEETK